MRSYLLRFYTDQKSVVVYLLTFRWKLFLYNCFVGKYALLDQMFYHYMKQEVPQRQVPLALIIVEDMIHRVCSALSVKNSFVQIWRRY